MKNIPRNVQPPGRECFGLVFRQARGNILFIGTHHHPVQLTPKADLARLKEKVENLDRIYIEGSSRMHHQRNAHGDLVNMDSVEWFAHAHHKGGSMFLDDLNTANRFELAKKYGLRPFAFAGLYASMGIVRMVELGMADAEEVHNATIRYLDTVRGWGEHFFPIKGSERATDAAMEAAIMCQADYGSLNPLEALANHFGIFNGMVRDAEIYGPLMRDVVSKGMGRTELSQDPSILTICFQPLMGARYPSQAGPLTLRA